MAPFSVIVFSVVVWTIAVSGVKQLRLVWKRISVDGALNIHNRVNTTQSNRTHRMLTKYANRYRHTFLIYFFKLKMVNFGAYRYLNQCTQIRKIGTARNIVERSYTGEEKCARFIYVVFFLFGWNFFFKITLIVITGTKFLNLLGYQQVLF